MDYDSLADLYRIQYAQYRDDLPRYTQLALDYGGPVLELGAGMGRVARAIARRGIEVVALEPSQQMLHEGQQVTEGLPVSWVQGDMRQLDLGRQFPLILAPFNTLMHLYTLDDQDAALQGILAHLAPGGRLAFDLYNPALIGPQGILQHEGSYDTLEVFVRQEHYPEAQMLITHHYLDQTDPKGRLSRRVFTLEQRYYTRFEVERWLRWAGLACRITGGFHHEPLRPDTATWLVEAWIPQEEA